MMKKIKKEALHKLFAITATFLIIPAAAAGCGSAAPSSPTPSSSASSTTPGSEDSLYTAAGEMPIVKEQIQLTIFAPPDGELSRDDNLQTKELEELTNIDIVWQIAPGDGIKEKMNLMFASNDMTDIVMLGAGNSNRLDMASEAMLGAQGLVIPLNDYFDTISVGYKNAMEKLDGMREYITTPDGNIYSLPNVDGSLHVQYNMKLWINTVWLDNLGLSMPATTDEFYNVMKAFKEQDANGNGDPNDEIPFSTVKSGAGTQLDGFLMNPFQLTPETTKLYLDNGTVTFSPVQDNYKEGLKYLHKLYSEGLINPESFTQDMNNQVNVNENGEYPVVGAFIAQRPGYATDMTTVPNSNKWHQYQSLPPLKGPSGEAVAAWNPYAMYQTGMTFITSSCQYPEAAFRLIDYLATPEGVVRSTYGIEGVHYRQAESGELGMDGNPAKYTRITGADTTNAIWHQLAGRVLLPEDPLDVTVNLDPYAQDVVPTTGQLVILYNASKEHEKVRQPLESVLPSLYMSSSDAEEMALIKTTVMDYANETLVRFVTGDMDIEKDWDTYISQLDSIGLARYLELLQTAYDNSAFAK